MPWRKKYLTSIIPLTVGSGGQSIILPRGQSIIGSKKSQYDLLKVFAEKCFSVCNDEIERDLMEQALKNKLDVIKPDQFESVDWLSEAVPEIKIHLSSDSKASKRNKSDRNDEESATQKIIGTLDAMEKPYFRLTSIPDPSNIRPESVLKRSFVFILDKWKKEKNISYILEQFKSLRQDISVQSIKNEFTIQVYETNALIAIDCGNMEELAQCLGQLISLYELYTESSKEEFLCYYILQALLNENLFNLNSFFRTQECINNGSMNFCKKVFYALSESDLFMLNELYLSSPYKTKFILVQIISKFYLRYSLSFQRILKPHYIPSALHNLLHLGECIRLFEE